MAFRGQYEHSLDSKDRITIPARFRAALAGGVVLSASFDPCVDVYPVDQFARFEANFLSGLNPLTREGRILKRRVYARSEEIELDSAGRIRLPRHLIEHAKLEGPCVVVGAGDHLEIWGAEGWAPEESEMDAKANETAQRLGGGPGGAAEG